MRSWSLLSGTLEQPAGHALTCVKGPPAKASRPAAHRVSLSSSELLEVVQDRTVRRHRGQGTKPQVARQLNTRLLPSSRRVRLHQRIDEWTADLALGGRAFSDQLLQRTLECLQCLDALPHVCELVLAELSRRSAGLTIVERQQSLNVVEREAERLRTLDEPEASKSLGRVTTDSAGRTFRCMRATRPV